MTATPGNRLAWISLALFTTFLLLPGLGYMLGPASEPTAYPARLVTWILATAVVMAGFLTLGWAIKGHYGGLLIDRRNRYSLARFQMFLWTVVGISTIYVALSFNVLNNWGSGSPLPTLNIDYSLVALMGLSVSSFLASPAALSIKATKPPKQAGDQPLPPDVTSPSTAVEAREGSLMVRQDIGSAAVTDLFKGEEVGNSHTVDLPRMQMLILTLILWIVYILQTAEILWAVGGNGNLVDGLVTFDDTLLVLILVSHGGYITGKVVPNTAAARTQTTAVLVRLTKVENEARDLIRKLETRLADIGTSDLRNGRADRLAALARQIITDCNPVADRIGRGDDVAEALARLEGRMAALASTHGLFRERALLPLEAVAGAGLVTRVKTALMDQNHLAPPLRYDAWTDRDEKVLLDYLEQSIGLPGNAIPDRQIDRLELAALFLKAY